MLKDPVQSGHRANHVGINSSWVPGTQLAGKIKRQILHCKLIRTQLAFGWRDMLYRCPQQPHLSQFEEDTVWMTVAYV
jgi:hypothetical protein